MVQRKPQQRGPVFPDRGPRDGCEDGFPGLLPSADVPGEQDGVGKDLLPEVRPFQDPPPVSSVVLSLPSSSLIRCSRFARDFLSGATSRRWISSPSFARANRSVTECAICKTTGKRGHNQQQSVFNRVRVTWIRSQAMRSPTRAVDHPLIFSEGGAAAQIRDSRAAGGSSPCFISTSITGVVDPDPSRRGRFTVATSSTSTTSFSFPRLAARAASSSPLKPARRVVAKGRLVRTGASVLGSASLEGSAFLDLRLIFVAGAGGRAEIGKLLIAHEKHKTSSVPRPLINRPQIGDPYKPCEPAPGAGGPTATVTTALLGVYFSARSYLGGSSFASEYSSGDRKISTMMSLQTVGFRIGDAMEVASNDEGFEGSYYEATVVGQLTTGNVYIVQYKNLMTDDFSAPLTENVPLAQIRPQPPQVQSTFFNM
nr:DUF724 domain-containing protein 3 [Ipomoea batatas]